MPENANKTVSKGDSVKLITGPFSNFIATVQSIDYKDRIWLLLDVLGQKAKVRVDSPGEFLKV